MLYKKNIDVLTYFVAYHFQNLRVYAYTQYQLPYSVIKTLLNSPTTKDKPPCNYCESKIAKWVSSYGIMQEKLSSSCLQIKRGIEK